MNSTPKRAACFHSHSYQPPRECPWTGLVEVQSSAAPYANWNARITDECYAANGRAQLQDNQGVVTALVNNYAYMSFNVGPTLLTWLADNSPETLLAMVEGDKASKVRCGGHGNAIAQVYNHMIMPLAHDRDKKTQVLWGKAVFQHYFGREPEGMHLAETAVDTDTLEALAADGVKFTILAPRQAGRFRKIGSDKWESGGIDPTRAYRCNLPSGNNIAVFFYDGPISQAVAFERLLDSGEKFYGRVMSGFNDQRTHNQLMHLAVDGETFGHHHRFGEMCLAWVLNKLLSSDTAVTNYGEFLANNPPQWEVEVRENTSWSCEHGVERWRSNCGCKTGSKPWTQEWRAPLRNSLNTLRAKLDALFDSRGKTLFADPWAARNDYIALVLDHGQTPDFLQRNCLPGLNLNQQQEAIQLLEMQRLGMLMLTSCAWFFDELGGIEPVQNLLYAARAIELASSFTAEDLEAELVRGLEQAPSNMPEYKNGRGVWEKAVRPQAVYKQIRALSDSALDDVETVTRFTRLMQTAAKCGQTFDRRAVQMRVLNAYARIKQSGAVTAELHAAYVALAAELQLSADLLGWQNAGICDSFSTDLTGQPLHNCAATRKSGMRQRSRKHWRS